MGGLRLLRYLVFPLTLGGLYALYLRGCELYDPQYCASQYYDAGVYYGLSKLFLGATWHFDLLGYDNALRGYLWPWILMAFSPADAAIAPPIIFIKAFRPLGAVLAALLFGVAGPLLWTRLRGEAPGWWRQAAFAALGFCFWRDYFHFALTDMPATLVLVLALALLLGPRPTLVEAGVTGLLLGAAIILRPIFLVAATVTLGGAAWQWASGRSVSPPRGLALLVTALLGVGVVLTPQWLINVRHFQQRWPLVLGWINPNAPRSLYFEQLTWGLQMQKYETSVAPGESGVAYDDPAGRAILGDALPAGEKIFSSAAPYIHGIIRHWPDAGLLYARHLFNGLDVRQPTPYLRPFNWWSLVTAWLNYSVWFGAALVLLLAQPTLARGPAALVMIVVGSSVAAVLPTAIEVRFLLPLHLLLYGVVAFGWPAHWTPRYCWLHAQRSLLLVVYGGFVVECFLLSAGAHAQWHGGNALLAP